MSSDKKKRARTTTTMSNKGSNFHSAVKVNYQGETLYFQVGDFVLLFSQSDVPYIGQIREMWEEHNGEVGSFLL